MATARLRRTFQYPGDDEDGTILNEGIDEEEQDKLIESIATQDAASSALYRKFFLAIPILGLLNYLRLALSLVTVGDHVAFFFTFYVFSFISLWMSLWMILDIPGLNFLSLDSFQLHRFRELNNQNLHGLLAWVRAHVTVINAGLCVVVLVFGLAEGRANDYHPMGGGTFSMLPPVCTFLMALVARRELQPVDIKGLQRLRYEYKGA